MPFLGLSMEIIGGVAFDGGSICFEKDQGLALTKPTACDNASNAMTVQTNSAFLISTNSQWSQLPNEVLHKDSLAANTDKKLDIVFVFGFI